MDTFYILCGILLGFLVIAYHVSSLTKYYMKVGSFYLGVFFISIPVMCLSLLTPRNVDNVRYFFKPFNALAWLLGVQFEIRNQHHIPQKQACLIVSNHQAVLEPLGLAFADLNDATFLATRENLIRYGPFGWASWLCGALFISRRNTASALKTIEDITQVMKTKKIKLWVFPEGYLCKERNGFRPFKKGTFHLAINAQIPIVPVVFSTFRHFYNEHETDKKYFNRGKVIMTCLPPVPTEGLTTDDVDDLTERVRNKMFKVFREITAEVDPSF